MQKALSGVTKCTFAAAAERSCRADSLLVHLLRPGRRRPLRTQRLELAVDELSGAVRGAERLPDDPRLAQEALVRHQQVQQVLCRQHHSSVHTGVNGSQLTPAQRYARHIFFLTRLRYIFVET